MTVVVTGGAGFIGSNFIFYMLEKHPDYRIVCIDKLTFADDGTIIQVKPTHEGIAPVDVSDLADNLITGLLEERGEWKEERGQFKSQTSNLKSQTSRSLYDLQGRRVGASPKKGLYISRRKKVIIK
jgi:hypothetical protein